MRKMRKSGWYSRYTTHKKGSAIHLDAAARNVVVIFDPLLLLGRFLSRAVTMAPVRRSLAVICHVPAPVPIICTAPAR
jgi:hypothetical protein